MRLEFPTAILDQHLVVLGKTGAGKSSALRYVVEYLLRHNKRVCIIDPKGDWWGLKSSADGKSAGFPVVAFGDFKNEKASDVPINAQSGRHVAELITSGNRPAMIGFRGWMTSHMVQFWIDFASGIFNANSGELYLIGDEFHNFAPKGKIMDPQAGKCLHWSNRLLSEGRGLGIVCLISSQRPQKVHNDTLTSCETLVAMRVVHAADRGAVEEWIKGCGDKEQGREVLNEVAGMARGEAFVWSPEIGFGPKRIKFPMFETFDSFAPPQLQKKISERGWADVDLNEVKEKLATVIEEHKSNDPRELKKKIAELRSELSEKPTQRKSDKIIEKLILKDSQISRIEKLCERMYSEADRHGKAMSILWGNFNEIAVALKDAMLVLSKKPKFPTDHLVLPQNIPVHRKPLVEQSSNNGSVTIGGGMKRMMIALAQRPGINARQLGVRSGMSSKSGTFGTYLAKLRTNGWMEGSKNSMRLTPDGLEALGNYDPLPEGRELFQYWKGQLGDSGAGRMLDVLYSARAPIDKEQLGELANISPTSGTFGTYLAKLRTLELVKPGQPIEISEEFFNN